MSRLEDWERGSVPAGVKFLVASVDVQGARFVVQIAGWGVGLECWIVDRFDISSSRRPEADRTAAVNPAAYIEDWDLLIDEVIRKTYPLADDSAKRMPIRLTVGDSGGSEGVTTNAYKFWRKCRSLGLATKYQLVKGDNRPTAPRVQQTYPDTRGRTAKNAGAAGDVPLWLLNVNLLKDSVAGDLARTDTGPGYVHFGRWLDTSFFAELTAETRGPKGWERTRGVRNESLDLHVYSRAACIMLKAEQIDWTKSPAWIAEQIINPANAGAAAKVRTIADLARALNG
jgi:phage terminase large subunit GpA-like protein